MILHQILCALGYLIKYEVNVDVSDIDMCNNIKYHNQLHRKTLINQQYISMNSHIHIQNSMKMKMNTTGNRNTTDNGNTTGNGNSTGNKIKLRHAKHSVQNCYCWNYISPHLIRKTYKSMK